MAHLKFSKHNEINLIDKEIVYLEEIYKDLKKEGLITSEEKTGLAQMEAILKEIEANLKKYDQAIKNMNKKKSDDIRTEINKKRNLFGIISKRLESKLMADELYKKKGLKLYDFLNNIQNEIFEKLRTQITIGGLVIKH